MVSDLKYIKMLNKEIQFDKIEEDTIKTSAYLKLARKIKNSRFNFLKKKIAIISSFTSDVIENFFFVELARRGILGNLKFFPTNQFEQNILDEKSLLYEFQPDVVILLPLIEDLWENNKGEVEKSRIQKIFQRYKLWISDLKKKSDSVVIASNFQISYYYPSSLADSQNSDSIAFSINEINKKLTRFCSQFEDCFIFDYQKTIFSIGFKNLSDQKLFFLGKIRQSLQGQIILSSSLARQIAAVFYVPKKCLVLDADNTLWGGIVGEEGINGIELSDSYPGSVFKEFHKYLLRLRSNGILLAISSKNNEEDVFNVFKNHPDSILKKKHFSSHRINWNDKAKNIKEISKELNIGLDSIVFIDDNPIEREWVNKKLPEVLVPNLPSDPINYIKCLEKLEAFDFLVSSKEDKKRATMYSQEINRNKEKQKSNSLDQFLKGLKMEARYEEINKSNIKRVAQLINKTNQFNLTLRRHRESDIKVLLNKNAISVTLRLNDKYGDIGLIAVAIAGTDKTNGNVWEIDTFLLSCRALGRNIEDLLLFILCEKIKSNSKKSKILIEGKFNQAKKNNQVATFYPDRNFKRLKNFENKWYRDIINDPFNKPAHIKVLDNEKRSRKKT